MLPTSILTRMSFARLGGWGLGGFAIADQPQQVMVPSLRIAQVWFPPAAIALNEPVGALICPFQLEPQQLIIPFGRNPHEWSSPAVTAVNNPLGGWC